MSAAAREATSGGHAPEGRVPGLDGLRALAITLVLVAHLPFLPGLGERAMRWKVNLGLLGVELFFALSGFLIGGILLQTGERLRSPRVLGGFWLNRWLRTLPNFYLIFAVNLVLGLWVFTRRHEPWQTFGLTAIFSQNLTRPPGWFFTEAWSLSVEEWFYLLLPAGLWIGLKLRRGFGETYVAMGSLMIVGTVVRRVLFPGDPSWPYGENLVVLNRFDALGCGVMAAWLAWTQAEAWRRHAVPAAVGGLLLIGGALGLRDAVNATAGGWRVLWPLLQPLGGALLLPALSGWAGWHAPMLGVATATLARWSYSLYLVNSLIAFTVTRMMSPAAAASGAVAWLSNAVFLLASLGLAFALHRAWEAPMLRLRERIPWCREANAARLERSVR